MNKWTVDVDYLFIKFTIKGITGRREFSWKGDGLKDYLLGSGRLESLPWVLEGLTRVLLWLYPFLLGEGVRNQGDIPTWSLWSPFLEHGSITRLQKSLPQWFLELMKTSAFGPVSYGQDCITSMHISKRKGCVVGVFWAMGQGWSEQNLHLSSEFQHISICLWGPPCCWLEVGMWRGGG